MESADSLVYTKRKSIDDDVGVGNPATASKDRHTEPPQGTDQSGASETAGRDSGMGPSVGESGVVCQPEMNGRLSGACIVDDITNPTKGECALLSHASAFPRVPVALSVIIDNSFSMGTKVELANGATLTAWELCVKLLGDVNMVRHNGEFPIQRVARFDLFVVSTRVEHKSCATYGELLAALLRIGPPRGLTDFGLAMRMAADMAQQRKAQGFRTFQFCMTDGAATYGDTDPFVKAADLAASVPMMMFAYSPVDSKYWRNIVKLGGHRYGNWHINKANADGKCSTSSIPMLSAFTNFATDMIFPFSDMRPFIDDGFSVTMQPRPFPGLPIFEWPSLASTFKLDARLHELLPTSSGEAVQMLDWLNGVRPSVVPHGLDDQVLATAGCMELEWRMKLQVKLTALISHYDKQERRQRQKQQQQQQPLPTFEQPPGPPEIMRRDSLYMDDDELDRCPFADSYAFEVSH